MCLLTFPCHCFLSPWSLRENWPSNVHSILLALVSMTLINKGLSVSGLTQSHLRVSLKCFLDFFVLPIFHVFTLLAIDYELTFTYWRETVTLLKQGLIEMTVIPHINRPSLSLSCFYWCFLMYFANVILHRVWSLCFLNDPLFLSFSCSFHAFCIVPFSYPGILLISPLGSFTLGSGGLGVRDRK